MMPTPLRNGSREMILCWEARLLPERVCEGGGWYSAHPTLKAWEIRHWPKHKGAPGYAWPTSANFGSSLDLEGDLRRIAAREASRYGFGRQAKAMEARQGRDGEAVENKGRIDD